MEVRWTSITLLLVTLVVKVHCYPEDHAQSSETTGEHKSITRKDSPLQQNVFSNAEFKSQDTEAEEITKTSTTELLVLPTPVAVTHEESYSDPLDTEKKPSVPKKGVPSTKSSVVPKKEVHFIPSVVAKKGADPESSTPSVSPRKGVELSQGSLIHNVQLASIENMNIDGNFSQSSSGDVNSKNVPSRIDETKNETHIEKETKENIIYIPNPHLVKKGKANDNLLSGKQNSSQTLVHLASTSPPTVHSKSGVVSNIGHFKPTTTDDVSATSSQVTYAPIFVIVALVVLLVVVVVVGYHRLKGIWVRRHYDYVDFLIDGMYE